MSTKLREGELPKELDFFKYAQASSGKRKADTSGTGEQPEGKKRRMRDEGGEDERNPEDESESEEDTNELDIQTPPVYKHRVTTKGSDVPDHIETFLGLQDRYQVPTLILSNLARNDYTQPTAIQSYGIPILLNVRIYRYHEHNCELSRKPSLAILLLYLQQVPEKHSHT